jgi:hypothetical protein
VRVACSYATERKSGPAASRAGAACSLSLGGRTLRCVSAETRRVLHALLERVGARLDDFERRLQGLERVAFAYDEIDERLARLEQRPPTPLGGRELQRQRVEAVLRVRAQGSRIRRSLTRQA